MVKKLSNPNKIPLTSYYYDYFHLGRHDDNNNVDAI